MVAVAAAAITCTAGQALAAGPAKASGGAAVPTAKTQLSIGTPAPAPDAVLLITFADAPDRTTAERRLRGLGGVHPVVPEAGVWRLTPDGPIPDLRARAGRRPAVAAAEWSLLRREGQWPAPPTPPGVAAPIGDPLFADGRQWSLMAQGGPAWTPDLTTTGPRPRIAVLDSGVDGSHEEWAGPDSPLVAPRNVIDGSADGSDWSLSGHGTHVAGIAAAPINGLGVVGAAPGSRSAAQVIPVRIADPQGQSTDASMMSGIRWAVRRGARVINISAGGPGYSRAFQDTVNWAAARGALIVASVGNDGGTSEGKVVNYPAGYQRVVGVGAQCSVRVSRDCPVPFGRARFTNVSPAVDLLAPGVGILSSVPVRVKSGEVVPGYAMKDGTSMAAPYVAGVAALVQAANGNRLSPYQLLRHLQSTAVPLESGGRNNRSGYGVVDPAAAVIGTVPADDAREVDDDIKWLGRAERPVPGRPLRFTASIDQLQDSDDVFPVRLRAGERVQATLRYRSGVEDLYVWGPGARTVRTDEGNVRRNLIRYKGGTAKRKRVVFTATRSGVHYLNVFGRRGRSDYRLVILTRSD